MGRTSARTTAKTIGLQACQPDASDLRRPCIEQTVSRRHRIGGCHATVAGHPTSLRLEPEWLQWIREIAAECGMSMKAFMTAVAIAKSPSASLTAALRLYIADYFYRRAPHNAFFDPNSRFHFRVGRSRKLPRARSGPSGKVAKNVQKPSMQECRRRRGRWHTSQDARFAASAFRSLSLGYALLLATLLAAHDLRSWEMVSGSVVPLKVVPPARLMVAPFG